MSLLAHCLRHKSISRLVQLISSQLESSTTSLHLITISRCCCRVALSTLLGARREEEKDSRGCGGVKIDDADESLITKSNVEFSEVHTQRQCASVVYICARRWVSSFLHFFEVVPSWHSHVLHSLPHKFNSKNLKSRKRSFNNSIESSLSESCSWASS